LNYAKNNENLLHKIIWSVSIILPILIFSIFYGFAAKINLPFSIHNLPLFHAVINGTAFMLLLMSWYAIIHKKIVLHKTLNWIALTLSCLFLLSYVTYHSQAPQHKFGGQGFIRYVYFCILISHILLSAITIPLVLFTLLRAYLGLIEQHKKIAKWTMPIWLYVTLTGVLVYILMCPYY